MLDLIEDLSRLKLSGLRIEDLAMHGVPYGCAASDFPIKLVTQVTLAPIVKSSSWSSEHGATYWDEDGKELSLSVVIENALRFGGVLHFPESVSFGFENGRVTVFAIYGKKLDFFRHIQSYTQFVKEFGQADVVIKKEAFGDLMGYEHYYSQCKKFVEWDEIGKKIVVINFGMTRHAASDA